MQALYYCLLSVFLLCACTSEKVQIKTVTSDTYFSISIDDTTPKLQLALTQSEWSRGLMYRNTLAEDHGMLFLFKEPGRRSFWMRNTKIPLDLAYFDANGKLLEIHSLYPYDENTVYSHSEKILIAIEMSQGWFSSRNIRPGAKLDLEALKQAVINRGHSIADYALDSIGRSGFQPLNPK